MYNNLIQYQKMARQIAILNLIIICFVCLGDAEKKYLNKFCSFTIDQCKEEPYNLLKSCQLALNEPEKLKGISDQFLCTHRDKLVGKAESLVKRSINQVGNNRTKRSTGCNICTRSSNQQIIYAAQDAQFGTERMLELVHNPAENLYQTYTVQSCNGNTQAYAGGRTHTCKKQMLEFTAAVFGEGDGVIVQNVKYPATCAFLYNC